MKRTCLIGLVAMAAVVLGGRPGRADDGTALFPIVQDGKWGYMDQAGKVVIQPQYDCAWDFAEGLACVQAGLMRGYIDPTGKVVIEPKYALARPFSEGVAAVYEDAQQWGGFVVFNRGSGRWIYIDKTGKVAIEPKRLVSVLAGEFHQGCAVVRYRIGRSDWMARMTTDGSISPPPGGYTASMGPYSEGLAAYQPTRGKFGYLDPQGKEALPRDYEDAGDFSEGLAPVCKDGKWGFIDKEGKAAFEGQFDGARSFAEGLAAVAVGSGPVLDARGRPTKQKILKWGCIEKTGKIVVEAKYDFVGPASEGMMRFVVAGKHGYMDASGKIVVEPKFDVGWEFHNGLARVEVEGKQGYIDKTGKYVWQPTSVLPPAPAKPAEKQPAAAAAN